MPQWQSKNATTRHDRGARPGSRSTGFEGRLLETPAEKSRIAQVAAMLVNARRPTVGHVVEVAAPNKVSRSCAIGCTVSPVRM